MNFVTKTLAALRELNRPSICAFCTTPIVPVKGFTDPRCDCGACLEMPDLRQEAPRE